MTSPGSAAKAVIRTARTATFVPQVELSLVVRPRPPADRLPQQFGGGLGVRVAEVVRAGQVVFVAGDGTKHQAAIGFDGKYVVELPPGEYQAAVEPPGSGGAPGMKMMSFSAQP